MHAVGAGKQAGGKRRLLCRRGPLITGDRDVRPGRGVDQDERQPIGCDPHPGTDSEIALGERGANLEMRTGVGRRQGQRRHSVADRNA